MSMLLMVKAMQTKVGNPLRKLVLIKLADNANDKGECWPSYQHIADQCEVSRRSVINHMNDLEKAGYLVKQHRKGTHKANSSNLYILRLDGAVDSPPLVQEIHPPSAGDSPPPSAGAAPRTSHSFEPVIEPKPLSHNAGAFETFEMNWEWEPDTKTVAFALSRSAVPLPVAQALANDAELIGAFVNHQLANPGRRYSASGWANRLAMWLLKDWQHMNRPTDEQQYRTARGFDLHPTNAGVTRHAKQSSNHVMSPREAAERNGEEFAVPAFARPAPASQPPEYTAGNTYDADDWG